MKDKELLKKEVTRLNATGMVDMTGDFQCDQTQGCPTVLCWNITEAKAWIQPSCNADWNDEEDIETHWKLCAAYGVRSCTSARTFNGLLKSLSMDAFYQEGLVESQEEIDVFDYSHQR